MKSLVLAEKPSVARDIARVLHCSKTIHGGIEGETYIVTWGLGHLVTLADPEKYEERYKTWKMEDLPMMPNPLKLEVISQTAKQYSAVKALLHRMDVKEVIIATDAGREGELVARWILEKAQNKKPVKRLWISSVTDKAIKEGFSHLRDGKEYENLYRAALCRAQADWLVGINATRALTCKYNAQLSCGRVQTPTLAMIAKREAEIKQFRPQSYYGLTAICSLQEDGNPTQIQLNWKDTKSGTSSTFQKEKIEAVKKELDKKPAVIIQLSKIKKKTFAPLLYDLTELQREANKRYQYSAKQTLNIMQRLYETHKVLTYPRTDSRYLTSDIVPTIKERLKACGAGPYKSLAGKLMNKPISSNASFVNNAKVSDHHAIIPTEQFVQLDRMSMEERRIYDLVVRRFLAVLYPAAEYEQTSLQAQIGNETFTAKGMVLLEKGWKEVYDTMEEEALQSIPSLEKGMKLLVRQLTIAEGKTKPPAYFTEATLLSAMENPVQYMQDTSQKNVQILKETGGLGTVATRADIIEKLFHSFFLEKKGNEIHITSKAKQLLDLVPEDLRKPELTADWEWKLAQIAKGNRDSQQFMKEIRSYAAELTDEIKAGEKTFRYDNITNKKCPNCGKRLLAVNGKNSKMLVCQDRECGYREVVSRTSNARCPVCHKKMELVGKGESRMFTCVCGYREKLSKFQERREKEGKNVSKKDIERYMKKQKTQEKQSVNSVFADALKNIKLD